MPRKIASITEDPDPNVEETNAGEVGKLNGWLAAVLNYLSDDDVEEIDIEYLLKNTEGLQEWWDNYRESNRQQIEEEIKNALGDLSLEELEAIREKIKEKES
ncbi:hypothetical protein H1D32_02720 [Anaerobacillus sp. CMMVII]|uniref:hypothetical protein n=1 Tax=Anaerobacillus sp. CMMVII TaxID=2755588 RepID=UPI0021B7541B|nr:hypothetical protein [Anaerobacillus sp. CMMVII]MCT8136762.1 hypothetical protein [Anaerobacillus sp. CMMVII]